MVTQDEPTTKADAPPLLVDAMLGSLARRLRLLGFDAAYWRTGDDASLVRLARAEGRLVVTRDRQVAARRGVTSVMINSDVLEKQVAQLLEAYRPPNPPFTRCLECNGRLAEIGRGEARSLVPPYVWDTQSRFQRCTVCDRVYWRGTHHQGLCSHVRSAFGACTPLDDNESHPS